MKICVIQFTKENEDLRKLNEEWRKELRTASEKAYEAKSAILLESYRKSELSLKEYERQLEVEAIMYGIKYVDGG